MRTLVFLCALGTLAHADEKRSADDLAIDDMLGVMRECYRGNASGTGHITLTVRVRIDPYGAALAERHQRLRHARATR